MLRVRWLGRVRYSDAHALQRALHARAGGDDHLLLLEHHPVVTLGLRSTEADLLVPAATLRAQGTDVERADRGGQTTWHGPGQLVGYPILTHRGGPGSVPAHVHAIEQVVVDALADLGLPGCGRIEGLAGVWVDPEGRTARGPRKICAVGARVTRGRTMHGFALNVDPDLAAFDAIVPCGITDKGVTSLAAEGIAVPLREVVDAVAARAARRWAPQGEVERQDVAWRVAPEDLAAFTRGEGPGAAVRPDAHGSATPVRLLGRLAEAGVDAAASVSPLDRKPSWMLAKVDHTDAVRATKRTLRDLQLVTVCEEAGCPNLSECWADGTATFMVLGERCTRACGFCLVDTRKPEPADPDEPRRVAEAVARMGLAHAVVTMVARDDLPDGGAAHVVATISAIRRRNPGTAVEVLLSDLKGDPASLDAVLAARPEVWNHNVETVPRLQRAVRPSASYARSLAVLARGKAAGLTTKTSIIVGMGEERAEVVGVLADLAAVGVDIVTIGQYLRPTTHHLPVARWWTPAELSELAAVGEALGVGHVEASPLTRSSYHARQAAAAVAPGA